MAETERGPPTASGPDEHLAVRGGFLLWSSVILACVGGPFLVFVASKALGGPLAVCALDAPCPTYVIGLNWLAIVSCAGLFGAVGVMTSLILRRRLDPGLSRMTVLRALLLVYGLGVIFATMLLAMFIGGFLQGNLFPSFQGTTSWLWLNFRVPDWGKLIVWSFVVGFSERLMPGVFDQLTERLSRAQDASGRQPSD